MTRKSSRDDERGATFVLTAITMVVLLWAGAMGVDLGFTVDGGRQAQAMADTAALDMARYINMADSKTTLAASNAYLATVLAGIYSDNGSNGVTLSATPGYLVNGVFTTPPANGGCYHQFFPNNPPCTAVMVTATAHPPKIFAGGTTNVSRSTIAIINPEDDFSIGTYLATFSSNAMQAPIINAILSKLGTSVSLTAVGYAGLVNTDVTVNQLISASGGLLTSSNVMTASLTPAQWLGIWQTAVAAQANGFSCGTTPTPSPCAANTQLSTFSFSNSSTVQLCQLVTINGSDCTAANSTLTADGLSAGLNVLQTLMTEAELANGTNAIDLGTSLDLNNVSDAQLSLTVGQVPAERNGPVGTTASTAQVTADLKLTVTGAGTVDIPFNAASGTATLSSVTCSSSNTFSAATIAGSTTAMTANMTITSASGSSALGTASLSGVSPAQSVGFNSTNVPPTASTIGAATNPNPYPIGSHTPTASITVNSSSSLPAWVNLVMTTILNPLFTALGSSLGPILQDAGVAAAGADIADLSANCGSVSLYK